MSYISTAVHKESGDVIVWERTDTGERVEKWYKAPYYFYVDCEDGECETIYGDKVTKLTFKSSREYYKAKETCDRERIRMWESDIPVETRVLSENYYQVPAPKLHVTMLDIENDYSLELGYASITNPYAPINAISLFHMHQNRMVSISVPPDDGIAWTSELLRLACDDILPLPDDYTTDYFVCKNEKELLTQLIAEIEDSDILCGWNSDWFDIPYIGKRIEIVLGSYMLQKLSFPGAKKPEYREVELLGQLRYTLDTFGRIRTDYMDLYKKYEQYAQPSYKLESIADVVLVDEAGNPNLPKMEYEGTLASLYKDDFAFFCRYNIRDSEILRGFEQKLKYVQTANQMYHLSTGQFTHVLGTLKLTELAIINYCHHELNLVVNNNTAPDIDRQIDGAYVLLPQAGLQKWIGSIDIASLYPSAIRSLNISPETLMGQFTNTVIDAAEIAKCSDHECVLELDTGEVITKTAVAWNSWIKSNKYAVSGYGTVFNQNKQGIVPAILTSWFATRKKYQALKKETESLIKKFVETHDMGSLPALESDEYNELIIKVGYYDQMQYTYKIKLNSSYGALTNLYFRFYDLRMGESTTGSGRVIIIHQARKVTEVLDGIYEVDFPTYETVKDAEKEGHPAETALHGPKFKGKFMSDSVVAGDTDSCYFKTHANNEQEAIRIADAVAEQVNASFKPFMQHTFLCNPGFDDIIKCAREVVSTKAIFVKKKHYLMHICNLDGKPVDKMKIMGVATKKTTLPKVVATKLNGFIEQLLKDREWDEVAEDVVAYKIQLRNSTNVFDLGLPKGVNGVEHYTAEYNLNHSCRLPGHVAASIHYNQLLIQYGDKTSLPITSGTKIKVFYLIGNHGKFKSVAIPTDAGKIPQWCLDNFKIDIDAQMTRLIDKPLEGILKAIGKRVPTRAGITFDSIFEF